MAPHDQGPLYARLAERAGQLAPAAVGDRRRAEGALEEFARRLTAGQSRRAPTNLLALPEVRALVAAIFAASPHLTSLIERDPGRLLATLACVPEERSAALAAELTRAVARTEATASVMQLLRGFKNNVALLTAVCDLAGAWDVMTVARHLSAAADAAVDAATRFLFRQAAAAGDWLSDEPDGYVVLGMGKYGARELNYSSDIDLIVFYDLARMHLRRGLEPQPFFVRQTRELVRLLHERTGDGYVFRTDLRLRPDPGATPLALSTLAALNYYESFGQNWERAALIKARPVAGDRAAGAELLKGLSPYIWRKYLDFAAIADIQAMKRQIHAFHGFASIAVAGHNIKLGRGGIREIEFFVQTQQLIAAIMGTAPRLARLLSRRRRMLDAVLDPGFFGPLPDRASLDQLIAAELGPAADFQEVLDRARLFAAEQQFLIGVRVLTGTISAAQAGGAYALLAERLIAAMQTEVEREMERAHGRVAGGAAVVVALGKLGGREMTAASDLDLIVIYDFDPLATQSSGLKPLGPVHYYNRFTQRLISAFSAPTAQGILYEVDMRLRPSGQKGPLATQLSSFVHYQANEAWTWEHMALTRARVVAGAPALAAAVERRINEVLVTRRSAPATAAAVREMRQRIAKEKGSQDRWELKQVRGGLVDLEFIVQYLQLCHAADHPHILSQNTFTALAALARAGLLPAEASEALIPAARLLNNLTQILRLCLDEPFDPLRAPEGLKALLARAGEAPDFDRLEIELAAREAEVAGLFDALVA